MFLGTLDDAPYVIMPVVEVWTVRREPWLAPVNGAVPHDRNEIPFGNERLSPGLVPDAGAMR